MKTALTILICLFTYPVRAYDANVVHPAMTERAFEGADTAKHFLHRLGLEWSTLIAGRAPADWAAMGATAEDHGSRPLNHFYDPIHEVPLVVKFPGTACITIDPLSGEYTASQWATQAAANDFGLAAARAHLNRALVASSSRERDESLVKLFKTLGHMMHLLQDMAQPQHTRNDAHPTSEDMNCRADPRCHLDRLELWSRYERWCRDHLNPETSPDAEAYYRGYPVVRLPSYGDYFNGRNDKGLAEYSSQNFVTEHTNYSDPYCDPFVYFEPFESDTAAREVTHVVSATTIEPEDGSATIDLHAYDDTVLSYATRDRYRGIEETNEYHSVRSIFDYDLADRRDAPVYSLPAFALERQARLLVPRAVGYSAGLLAHFFRGSIEATWIRNQNGSYKLIVTNTSEEPLRDAHLKAGFLTERYGSFIQVVDQLLPPLASGESTTIDDVIVPGVIYPNLLEEYERRLSVVGTLGSETGAVIGLVQPADVPPPGMSRIKFTVTNPGEDITLAVRTRYYNYLTFIKIQDGSVTTTINIPRSRLLLPDAEGEPLTIVIDFVRGSWVLDATVFQHCSLRPTTVTLTITLDGEPYAAYTTELEPDPDSKSCGFRAPYFY